MINQLQKCPPLQMFVIKIFNCNSNGGPGSSSGKMLGYGLDGPGSIPGVRGVKIFLHSFVPKIVGVHPASYKMSTESFPWR